MYVFVCGGGRGGLREKGYHMYVFVCGRGGG